MLELMNTTGKRDHKSSLTSLERRVTLILESDSGLHYRLYACTTLPGITTLMTKVTVLGHGRAFDW